MGQLNGTNRSRRKVKGNVLSRTANNIYKLTYIMGINTVRSIRRTKKRTYAFVAFLSLSCFNFVVRILSPVYRKFVYPHLRMLAHKFYNLGQNVKTAAGRVGQASRMGTVAFINEFFRVVAAGYKRYKKTLFTAINWTAPVAAVFALVFVINGWAGKNYALAVIYDGKEVAYVSDESVFNEAKNMFLGRVIAEGQDFELEEPVLKAVEAKSEEIITSKDLCDKLLVVFADEVKESVGLYIDNVFVGAVTDYDKLACALDSVLCEKLTGKEGERAEFDNNVQLVSGYFPSGALVPVDHLVGKITGKNAEVAPDLSQTQDANTATASGVFMTQLKLFNSQTYNSASSAEMTESNSEEPVLKVRIARLETYEKSIPFKVQENPSTSYYEGYRKVTVKGKDGVESITDEVVYLDGVEVSRTNVNKIVIKEPVNEQVTVGKRKVAAVDDKYKNVKGNGVVTGKFGLPIIGYGCNSGYKTKRRPSHSGMDFASPKGTNILAADGGVVESVKFHGSYGLYVVVRHENGYSTLYAHMSKAYVTAGQKVSKGQVIGAVGSTGRSTGNHLHFEIRINGTPVNPAPYLGIPNGK